MVCSDVTHKLLILSKIKGIGPKALIQLSKIKSFESLSFQDMAEENNVLKKKLEGIDLLDAEKAAEYDISEARNSSSKIISVLDSAYPSLMKDISDKPAIVYVKGNFHSQEHDSIAIIGTREPTEHGKIITERISEFFVDNNYSIVSGLAIGCDTIAHDIAVKNAAHTVAVLSHGLQTIAPKQNIDLAKKILDTGGLLLTEYLFGTPVRPFQYVQRDRIQAALSKGVVMIQSDLKGGSLHASRATLKYNRKLVVPFPTPADIESKSSKTEANILIANDNIDERINLLKCSEEQLKNIFVLRGKNDYNELLTVLKSSSELPSDSIVGQQSWDI
ncbi:MAG: DNA-processing protein DprA [Campylobacterota bacterium]|nr:DNA-processing protein DprA [Campylobacterota bacterium]